MTAPRTHERTALRDVPWLLAILGASVWQIFRSMGQSPTVWIDTLFENVFIQDCLQDHDCSLVGAGATAGIFHSAGYLHWRIFLEWAGVGPDGTHGAILVATALGVMLAAVAALRIDGRFAAAIATLLVIRSIGIPTQLNVVSDVAPLPFLGCVFLVLALAADTRPSLPMTALLGIVGGVMANVYATGLLCTVTSVWLALRVPQGRWKHVAVAVIAFGVSTFVIAPGTWITDAQLILSHGVVGNAVQGAAKRALFSIPLARLTAASIAIWIVSAIVRPSFRRRLDVTAAIIVPLFVPLALGSWTGKLDPQDKYCSHIIGAVAVALAVSAASAVRAVWSPLARRGSALLEQATAVLSEAAPYAAAGFIAWTAAHQTAPENAGTLSHFTYRDVANAQHILTTEHGWAAANARQNLRTLDDAVKRSLIEWPRGWHEAGPAGPLSRAYLLRVAREHLPPSLPPTTRKVTEDSAAATLLVYACSWIDWSSFRACVRKEGKENQECADSGVPAEQDIHSDYGTPGMPAADDVRKSPQYLTLRFPLKPDAACPVFSVHMPDVAGVCHGRIVGATGASIQFQQTDQWAVLTNPESGKTPELAIEWNLGETNCSREYRGAPPFFIEGDPASVDLVASTLPVWR